jgi:putative cardiolipin synthase
MKEHLFIRLFLAACMSVMLLPGCSTLNPIELPDETASAPAESPLWEAVAAAHADNALFLLNDGSEALEWRMRMINSATVSLDLQTFLWKEDRTGLLLFRQILAAADRGIRIRLLVDDTFTVGENDLIYDLDRHPNIEFRIYNPFKRRYNSLALRQLMNLGEFSRLDHRMHNKVMVADNRAAIVGGRNLADEYFGHHEKGNFRDMEILCTGPVVQDLSLCFDLYWNSNWSFPASHILDRPPKEKDLAHLRTWLDETADSGLQENPADRRQEWITAVASAAGGTITLLYDEPAEANPANTEEQPNQLSEALLGWIDRAEKELVLVSAYLIPTPELEAAVERAEKRGVAVRILTNSLRSNNHISAHSAYRHHLQRLIGHGADLHEVRSRAKDRSRYMLPPVDNKLLGLHAKLLLIDDQYTFIGSANLDPRSLHLNTEIGLLIDSPEINRQVRKQLAIDFHLRNAWHLRQNDEGKIIWVADDMSLPNLPADSQFQRLEDWFLGILPIEDKM